MAQLDNEDFTKIKEIIHNEPALKEVFKAWNISKTVKHNLLQACEDWFVTGFNTTPTSSLKASFEVVLGGTTTNARAQAVATAWAKWRFDQ